MKSMKKLLKDDSSRILDCGNNQFHAALSMEARSRSPLPPSPTTTTTLHNIESTTSNTSITESIDSAIKKLTVTTPVKPPRKTLPTIATYEIVDKYDQIEYRNDAWRTLGVDNVKHTDNAKVPPLAEEDEVYMSWGDNKKDVSAPMSITKAAPKVITETSTHDNYDQLNFFGSSTKLNLKSGYKQVPMGSGNPRISPPCFNEYDEVQAPAINEIRLADDSHNGYGRVRKLSSRDVDHHFHNDEPYAVISKPKRV